MEKHNFKLQDKYQKIRENEVQFETYMIGDAEIVLVSFGISSRIAKSAVDAARKEGLNVGLFRPITLFPFPSKELKALADKGCKFISIEMNNGMMREDIRLATGCANVDLVCRYGGRLIDLEDIMKKIKEVA